MALLAKVLVIREMALSMNELQHDLYE